MRKLFCNLNGLVCATLEHSLDLEFNKTPWRLNVKLDELKISKKIWTRYIFHDQKLFKWSKIVGHFTKFEAHTRQRHVLDWNHLHKELFFVWISLKVKNQRNITNLLRVKNLTKFTQVFYLKQSTIYDIQILWFLCHYLSSQVRHLNMTKYYTKQPDIQRFKLLYTLYSSLSKLLKISLIA